MWHWHTTGNSSVAIQTGNNHTSDSMTDITTIPTADQRFLTRASSQKVSTSDYNIEQHPEIGIWPPKPETVIPLKLQQTASKFQWQVQDFRPWRARIKCRQVIATMNDNWKWQYGPKTGITYISGTITDRMTIPTANLGFSSDCDNEWQPEMGIETFSVKLLQFLVE